MGARSRRVVLPFEEWRQLGTRRRREVARCARHGRPHPDPHVAAVALAWAARVAARSSIAPAARIARSAGVIALAGAIGALVGDLGYALLPGSGEWRERRLARRVLAADSGSG